MLKFEPLENYQTIIEQASSLLERMPAWPPELIDTPIAIPLECRASSVADNARRDARLWEQLQATTYVSITVLQAALSVVMNRGITNSLLDMINIIATLLEIVSQLVPTITDVRTTWRSFIIRAFLWMTWQRCQLLYFHLAATDGFNGFDGGGSMSELITPDGFVAEWLLWKFDSTAFWQPLYTISRAISRELQRSSCKDTAGVQY